MDQRTRWLRHRRCSRGYRGRPNRSRQPSTAPAAAPRSRWRPTARTRPGRQPRCRRRLGRPRSADRPLMATRAPSTTNAAAMPRPMPSAPPVTSATRASSRLHQCPPSVATDVRLLIEGPVDALEPPANRFPALLVREYVEPLGDDRLDRQLRHHVDLEHAPGDILRCLRIRDAGRFHRRPVLLRAVPLGREDVSTPPASGTAPRRRSPTAAARGRGPPPGRPRRTSRRSTGRAPRSAPGPRRTM